tara:strand:+ start:126 stop:572 length:447 start_codon:yes stop_codon:yes gene_type:complete
MASSRTRQGNKWLEAQPMERNKEPEQKLWVAVLAKAFDDAFYCTDTRIALEALSWIRHGIDFNYVCHLAGRDPNYVRSRMLNKVIQREASILAERDRIKRGVNNIILLKEKLNPVPPKATYKKKKERTWVKEKDFKWLPKYQPTYVDR